MKSLSTPSHLSHTSRLGRWLPSGQEALSVWMMSTIEKAEKKRAPFHPVIQEFQEMIESDPVMLMYFTQMVQQQPHFAPLHGSGDIKVKNYHQMLKTIDHART